MPRPTARMTSNPPDDPRAVTARSANFSEWFQETVSAASLVRYSDVSGCFIFDPNGAELWDRVRAELDAVIKATGHKTVMYPTLIPESLLKREADHIEGFAPELARVTSLHGQQLVDPLVLRPTSEAVIYNDWRKTIRSEADLPVMINQWCNVFRVERRTRPLLRTFEFYWQEGHTAHATEKEAREETLKMLYEYARFMREKLAIPVLVGRKTELEKFAGARETYSVEAMMQDGKALQSATSHFFGSAFADSFGVQYQGADNTMMSVHTTSWGLSTRILGAIVMVHGDDNGLVLPPRIAPVQAAILAVRDEKTAAMEGFDGVIEDVRDRLAKAGVRTEVDAGGGRLGEKHFKWEKVGTPIRVVIGSREAKEGTITLVRRDTRGIKNVPLNEVGNAVLRLLDRIHGDMYDAANAFLASRQVAVSSQHELFEAFRTRNVFATAGWCGEYALEEKLKRENGLTIRCMPFEPTAHSPKCFWSGLPARQQVIIAKAY